MDRGQPASAFGGMARRVRRAAVGADRFELYLARIVGVFGVLYALQTAQAFVIDLPSTPGTLGTVTAGLVLASVLCGLGATLRPRWASYFLYGALALYSVALVVWIAALRHPVPVAPYPYFPEVGVGELAILAVACRRISIGISVGVAFATVIGVALATAGRMPVVSALSDAVFLVGLAIGWTLLVTAVRRGLRRADEAQAASLAGYSRTRAADATEAERRRTDALLHDAVLTTYLAAASAETPEERQLAVRMAANARRVLAHVTNLTDRGPAIPFDRAWDAIVDRLAPLLPEFDVHDDLGEILLPLPVADAMLKAMLEAMTNSVRHAHAAARELQMIPLGSDGLRITVRDDGIGFDASLAALAATSMRRTVIERLRLIDGRADVQTSPGQGCAVVLSWGSIVMSGVDPLPSATATATASAR